MYAIQRNAPEVPIDHGMRFEKSAERKTMEQLGVGDAFMVTEAARVNAVRTVCHALKPATFTVRKVAGQGWQVRRTA